MFTFLNLFFFFFFFFFNISESVNALKTVRFYLNCLIFLCKQNGDIPVLKYFYHMSISAQTTDVIPTKANFSQIMSSHGYLIMVEDVGTIPK